MCKIYFINVKDILPFKRELQAIPYHHPVEDDFRDIFRTDTRKRPFDKVFFCAQKCSKRMEKRRIMDKNR